MPGAPARADRGAARAARPGGPLVTYCWGPGCDGATRGALALARAGFRVKEMPGGIEYRIREGFAVETAAGRIEQEPDPLTTPWGC
ncbi:MAG TPA: hypothetical protein VGO23_21455 [Pseudonocardia sp.]|nr:hypothetical protein [Pseudonocardia sp.]